jgi:PadR family transcriptional regulator PadR
MTQITALVLRAVAAGHRYGFDVMEACDLPSGTVYPALRRLAKAGLLSARWESEARAHADARPRRRIYELTRAGREALGEAEAKLAEVRERLGSFPPVREREA